MRLILNVGAAILLIIFSSTLQAHPSWGIVTGPDGTIYFVDVMHNGDGTLWKLKEDGSLSKMITNIHAHQMVLDKSGKLYVAEAIWRQGEIEGEGHNYLFEISPDGKMDTLIFTDDWDLFFGGGFALNSRKDVFFSINKKVWLYNASGKSEPAIDHKFEALNTIYCDSRDRIWITDRAYKNGTLFMFSRKTGLVEVGSELIPDNPVNPPFEQRRHQMFYGISEDAEGNIYVAENGWRKIYRVDVSMQIEEYYQSDAPWYPVGITFQNDKPVVMEAGYDRKHLGPRILEKSEAGGWKVLTNAGDCQLTKPEKGNSEIVAVPDITGSRFLMIGIMLLFSFISYQFIGRILSE